MNPLLIFHYDEIGLKGSNRAFFEKKLSESLRNKAASQGLYKNVQRMYGRFFVEMKPGQEDAWKDIAQTTFGVISSSIAIPCDFTLEAITKEVIAQLQHTDANTFAIRTKRSDKGFPYNSQETDQRVGAAVVQKLKKRVNLRKPDITCYIEIVDHKVFVYTKKNPGVGGLPIGSAGKAIVLTSGGIDSPVAAWYAAKRGLRPVYLHFHSYPYTKDASIEKVKQLVTILSRYTNEQTLYLYPFVDVQKHIVMHAPEQYRIILYRRAMLRIAERLAWNKKAKALVTGEALGQVASQTIENIRSIGAVATLPIIRPLVAFDKQEIIQKAREIGTFTTSVLPHDDCCTVFMPRKPKTRSTLEAVEAIERTLSIDTFAQEALKKIEKITL